MKWESRRVARRICLGLCLLVLSVHASRLQAANRGDSPDARKLWYTQPTDERLKRADEGSADPLLLKQVLQYGRYLMIVGSRPGTQPLHLQEIWNNDLDPRWESKYTINIDIEMNDWVAEVCNLSECHEIFGSTLSIRATPITSGSRILS